MLTDHYLPYSSHLQTSCEEAVISYLLNRAYSIITNKDDLTKENARIKQVLKKNAYQESIISNIFKRFSNNHSLSHSQKATQAADIQEEDIRMTTSLPSVEGTNQKTTAYTQISQNKIYFLYCKHFW